MEMEVQLREAERGGLKRRWLDRVRGDINENGLSGTECRPTTPLHGHVYRRTSTPDITVVLR